MHPTPWREAWSDALYGPDGFFLRERPADHFRTSVAASPVFALAVRRLAGLVDDALGRPDPFDVVDVGAGRGELLSSLPDVPARWRLTGVDLAASPGGPFGWSSSVPPVEGLLFSNEWLDDVPLDVLFDGRVVEVSSSGQESLGGPGTPESLAWAARWWPQGRRVEVGLARDRAWGAGVPQGRRVEVGLARDRAWASAVAQVRRGLAVAVDYGHVLGDRGTWGDRRPTLTGWLRGRPVHPAPDGSCDITAHVALDSLQGRLISQQEALGLLGIRSDPPPRSLADSDPRGYLAQLATASSASELMDRRGLGAYGWVVVPVGIDDPLVGSPG